MAPHGLCLLWRPELIWLHALSDGFIAVAYFSIPIVLSVFLSKRPDFGFGWAICAFVVFITACGATHVFGIWTLWYPDYAAEGAVKGLTALASAATAIGLWPLLHKVLALPSPRHDASDARIKGGTGLGLSIVKQIVTRLGGEVAFENVPGGGTVFHVDLPRLNLCQAS